MKVKKCTLESIGVGGEISWIKGVTTIERNKHGSIIGGRMVVENLDQQMKLCPPNRLFMVVEGEQWPIELKWVTVTYYDNKRIELDWGRW